MADAGLGWSEQLRRVWRRMPSRLGSVSTVAVSIALLTAAVGGAVATLPSLDRGRSLAFDIDASVQLPERVRGGHLAVFALGRDGSASRVGHARAMGRGVLAVQLYNDVLPPRSQSLAVLLHADARLLWAVTSDANKAKIRYALDRLAGEIRGTFGEIAQSAAFRERYQPALQAMARRAFDHAAGDPDVQQAVAGLPPLQDVIDRELVARYLVIVLRNSMRNLGDIVGNLPRSLWGDGTPQRLEPIFNSPDSRRLIAERVRDVARSPEVARLLADFGRPFLTTLVTDPALPVLLQEIATDPVFHGRLVALEHAGLQTARLIARLLVEGDRDDRMHAFAATILRGLFLDNSRWLVAFVTGEQLQVLRQAKAGGVVVLVPRAGNE